GDRDERLVDAVLERAALEESLVFFAREERGAALDAAHALEGEVLEDLVEEDADGRASRKVLLLERGERGVDLLFARIALGRRVAAERALHAGVGGDLGAAVDAREPREALGVVRGVAREELARRLEGGDRHPRVDRLAAAGRDGDLDALEEGRLAREHAALDERHQALVELAIGAAQSGQLVLSARLRLGREGGFFEQQVELRMLARLGKLGLARELVGRAGVDGRAGRRWA